MLGNPENKEIRGNKEFKPAQIIVFGFIIVILLGTILLSLPISSQSGDSIDFIDAFFTATSAVCVTGLVTVNTFAQWTLFGKIIILMLIQLGALGFMTLVAVILLAFGKKINLSKRIILQESFNLSSFSGMVNFVKKIIFGTLFIESIGALLLFIGFLKYYSFGDALFKGIFHSVSAFCNAGFDILGDSSLMPFVDDYLINFTLMGLIIIGGAGFTVWFDLISVIKRIRQEKIKIKYSLKRMTLHSKLVITISLILILLGFVSFFIMEYNNPQTIGNLSLDKKLLVSIFQSVTLRTAGFNTISQNGLTYGSKFLSIFLMVVGGSPGGTAGGIKTVTIGVLFISIISVIKGCDSVNAFKKSISFNTLQKALSVIMMMITFIFISTILISINGIRDSINYEFLDILFETSSALGTVGLSTGITPHLTIIGKIIIIICMFIGRIGPVTIALALSSRQNNNQNLLRYPEEKILVG